MPAARTFLKPALLLAILFSFFSCKTKNNNKAIKTMEKSLGNSSKATNISNQLVLRSMENRMNEEPWLKEMLGHWISLAHKIDTYSKKAIVFIEHLKKEKKITINHYRELYQELKTYKNDITILDSSFKDAYLTFSDLDSISEEDFIKSFFSNASVIASQAILTTFQNSIATTENKLLNFCNSRVTSHVIIIDEFISGLVSQNSTILKPGETLELTAGIGEFRREPQTRILISGTAVPVNEEGYATYKVQVTKPGKHSIPVRVSFLNSTTGKEEYLERNVEYRVVKECDQ